MGRSRETSRTLSERSEERTSSSKEHQRSSSTKVDKEEDSQREGKEAAKGGDDDPAPIMNALQMLQFGLKLNRKSETVVSEEPGTSTEPSPKGKKAKKREKKEK